MDIGCQPSSCHITGNDGTQHHGGPIGTGTTDNDGWIKVLKPFVEETAASSGEIQAAAAEFRVPDPDAEIVRIREHLERIGLDLANDF